jgi:FdhD protein
MKATESNPGSTEIAGAAKVVVRRFAESSSADVPDSVAVEEPLEIRIVYGARDTRDTKSISVTMRTPGNDAELAVGFLLTEGVIRDADEIDSIASGSFDPDNVNNDGSGAQPQGFLRTKRSAPNVVTVELLAHVEVNAAALQRNFYTTSSCGVCGKASLLALRAIFPPRAANTLTIEADALHRMPAILRTSQGVFQQTGGLHAAALFDCHGDLDSMREDVGRHNALDKLVGAAAISGRLPLRNRVLLLSGRASFELLQKAVMAGIPMVAAVGAPSSLAVEVAEDFDVTLIGFLREDHFNAYHGAERVRAS